MSGGMCPFQGCSSPVEGRQGYCTRHRREYQRNRMGNKRRLSRKIANWNWRQGEKQAPTDWREVLRKADEGK